MPICSIFVLTTSRSVCVWAHTLDECRSLQLGDEGGNLLLDSLALVANVGGHEVRLVLVREVHHDEPGRVRIRCFLDLIDASSLLRELIVVTAGGLEGSTHSLVDLLVDVGLRRDLPEELIDSCSLLRNLLLHLALFLHKVADQVARVLPLHLLDVALDSLQASLRLCLALTELALPRLLLLDALVDLAELVLRGLELGPHLLHIALTVHREHVEALGRLANATLDVTHVDLSVLPLAKEILLLSGQHVAALHHGKLIRHLIQVALRCEYLIVETHLQVQVLLRLRREHHNLLAEVGCSIAAHLPEHLTVPPLFVILDLLSFEMEAHLGPLLLSEDVSALGLISLGPDDLLLLVQPHEVMVHPPHSDELLLQELLLVDQEGLCLADSAGDLLAGTYRFEFQLVLPVELLLDVLLELHLLELVVAELLLNDVQVTLGRELLLLDS